MGLKTNILRTEGLKITLKNGQKQMLYFNANEINKNVGSSQ